MEHQYKGHRIVVSAWQLGEAQWVTEYQIVGHDIATDHPTEGRESYRFQEETQAEDDFTGPP